MKKLLLGVLGTFLIFLGSYTAVPVGQSSARDLVSTGFLSNRAASGYDVVAYFTEKTPMKGNKEYSTNYKGAVWLFASQANLDAFKSNPDRYAPQYGGYCAYALADNHFVGSDPRQWSIFDGKLYLNADSNVRNIWIKERSTRIPKANRHWARSIANH